MKIFMFFVFVTIVDIVFTIIGIRNGTVKEANIIIRFIDDNSYLDIYQSIIVFKLMAIFAAYWIVMVLPFYLQKIKHKLSFPFLAGEEVCEKILLALTIITGILGAFPSLLIQVH